MNFINAKDTLQDVLNNQVTIRVSKLKDLLNDLNFTLEPSESKEVMYLKNEVKKLHKVIRKLQKEEQG